MKNVDDIRWKQRFSSYQNALFKLKDAINYYELQIVEKNIDDEQLINIVKEGLIQRFEYTYELAWNLMKDYAFYQGNSNVGGSRDAIKESFKLNLISDCEIWFDIIASRMQTSHNYNEETVNEIFNKIKDEYVNVFFNFYEIMKNKINEK